ncbi:FHA domain-containing protein [Janibacter corallicola]|uniref:FHA domain-containing protein n=1 Tax=Janibacter corallicola TaxID=415212 RepID=UPI00083050FD|nr:FHA domain-containing protein [Janibacter corallicola]
METRIEAGVGWIEVTRGGLSVLAKGDDALRDRLISALEAAPEDDPVDVVTDELTTGGVRRAPDFAIADEGSRRLLVRGSALARVAGQAEREVAAPARGPWSEEDIDDGVASVTLVGGEPEVPAGHPEHAAEDDQAPEEQSEAAYPEHPQFHDGHLISPLLVPGAEEEPQPEQGAEEPHHDTGDLPAGPMVLAVSCSQGHPNPPDASNCRVCREAVPEQQAQMTARPSLGVLHLSTGESVTLDRDVRLGRAPKAGEDATSEPHLIRISSPENEISRTHAEVVLDGWRVLVRDLGSTNGTFVTAPGGTPEALQAGQEVAIGPGATITLADRVSLVLEVAGQE